MPSRTAPDTTRRGLAVAMLSALLPLDAAQALGTAAGTGTAGAGWVQLLPAGEFASRDGRPGPGRTWTVTDADGAALAADISRIAASTPIVIDYEHQTLHAPKNGQPAPAAGWILRAEWRAGQGLWGQVEWTDTARSEIQARRYRYISPVLVDDEATGRVTGVLLAAITNHPGLLGMSHLQTALSAAAQLLAPPTTRTAPEPDMDLLTALITALGLPAGTSQETVLTRVSALSARPAVPVALTAALGLPATATETAAAAAVQALSARVPAPAGAGTAAAAPDLTAALAAVMAPLQAQVTALSARIAGDEVATLLDRAVAEHRVLPALRPQLETLGRSDITALRSLVAAMPVIPGLGGQTTDAQRQALEAGAGVTALTAQQTAIATQLGLDPKVYAQQLQAQAKA
jgi:phage I-like protein